MKHPNKHADDLIEMLATAIEAGTAPWQKPWRCDAKLPENLVTGRTYTGRNLLMLITAGAIADYNDHRWAGFQQIKAAGGHVRRGEHGHWICIMRSCGGGGRQQDSAETDLARNNPRGHGRSRNPKEGAGVHVHHVPAGVERSAVRGHRAARGRSEVLPIYIVGLGGRPPTFTIIALTAIPANPQGVGTAVDFETHFASAGLRVPRPHGDARVRRPVRHPDGRGTESRSAPD